MVGVSPAEPPQPRVYAVLNPARPRHARARALLEAEASARGWPLTVLDTTIADPGAGQALDALDAGATLVVVGGGDGTVRVVAGVLAGSGVPLGIVPLGTANLFARNLGLRPGPLAGNVRNALTGRPRRVDVGWSRHRRGDRWSDEEPFLVVAGLGHDAATVLATRAGLKRWLRWLAYFGAGAVHLFRAPIEVEVAVDGRPARHVRTWCVLVGNCGRLPGGVRVFPDARPDDGVLDTLVVPIRRPWQWLSVAAKGLLHLKRDVRALEYGRAHDVVVRPLRPQPLQLDGDAVPDVDEAVWRLAASELTVLTHDRDE